MNPYDQPWNESHKQTQFDLPKDVQLGVGGWFNQHQDNKYIKGLVLGWFLKTCCLCYQTYCGTDFFLTRIETTAFVWIHPEFFFGTQDMVKLAQLDAVLLCAAIEFFGSNRHGGFVLGGFRSFRFKEKP